MENLGILDKGSFHGVGSFSGIDEQSVQNDDTTTTTGVARHGDVHDFRGVF